LAAVLAFEIHLTDPTEVQAEDDFLVPSLNSWTRMTASDGHRTTNPTPIRANHPRCVCVPATRVAPRRPVAWPPGARGHDALDGLASRYAPGAPTHRATAAVRLDRSPSMATLAPRPRLLLALRRPQPRRLRACAAAPCARRAPGPPQAARPRRVFLGLGATVIDQVARMASGGTSSRSFVAGARPRQGVSPVEQVILGAGVPCSVSFSSFSFSKILL